jgi:hypothetical protein
MMTSEPSISFAQGAEAATVPLHRVRRARSSTAQQHDVMTLSAQPANERRADLAGASGNDELHRFPVYQMDGRSGCATFRAPLSFR